MSILKKLAAAVAVIMAVSTLAACGNDDPILLPQEASKPSGGINPVDKITSVADEYNDAIFKSKVTSADSFAKELITTVNTWIADNVAAGGDEKTACELSIVMDNGNAAVTDLSGKNDWEKRKGCPESLKERFEADYSGRTFIAAVFIDESGYAVYSWCVQDDADFNGDAPSLENFTAGEYEWKAEDRVGMTRDGVIMGTFPRLFYSKSSGSASAVGSKPSADGDVIGDILFGGQVTKSKVTSADITAKELITSVNSWIADDVAMGGDEKTACELRIVMNNDKAVVIDLSGANDWGGTGKLESLAERLEEDYSGRTFTAGVIIDKSGYTVYVWCVLDDPTYNGVSPSEENFKSGYYNWSSKIDGLTDENVIIGTYPKLRGEADER
ncbi:MAG: hypothetical protein K2J77_01880 [Oscillospiraceae bacterium]|nr:hypothetical protein [Oscillospiraceae bacterium]